MKGRGAGLPFEAHWSLAVGAFSLWEGGVLSVVLSAPEKCAQLPESRGHETHSRCEQMVT